MAITVASDRTIVNTTGGDAESYTNWTETAAWSTAGVIDGDMYLQGSNCIGARASAAAGPTEAVFWSHLTTGTANLDLTGFHVYFWIKCITLPSMDTRARGGIGLSISSTAAVALDATAPWTTLPWRGIADSKQWFLTGNDFDTTSGWVCYVVDPFSTADFSRGTPVMTSVDRIGIRAAVLQVVGAGSFKPKNILWDYISYATKLTITGSTGTFQDIFAADSTGTNQYGILRKAAGIFLGGGKLIFGTTGQSAPCIVTDTKQTLVWQDFPVAQGFYEIQLVGNTTPNVTTMTLGTYSGGLTSDGCTIRGVGLDTRRLIAPVIVGGGTTYVVGDILTVVGGTGTVAAQFEVYAVSSGVITAIVMKTAGSYSVPPTGTLSVTDARNSSATFTATVAGGSTWTLTASAANQTLNLYDCKLSEMVSATLASTSTLRGCTITNSGTVTPNGALIDNTTFQDLRTATPISATYALIINSTSEMANITNCKFVNCNRAIQITVAGNYTFTGDTFSGNTYDIENSASGTNVSDIYSETNSDGTIALNNTVIGVSQSFTGDGNKLANAVFYLSKNNTPTGNAVAKVYAHSGTFASSSVPTGTALATSKPLDVSTLTGSLALTTFLFADQDQNITLTNTTKYVVTIEYSGGTATNTVNVGRDASSATAAGSCATLTGTTWTSTATTTDACFYVRTGGVVIITLANGSNPSSAKVLNSAAIPGATTINTGVNVTVHVQNASQAAITSGAKVTIFQTSDPTVVVANATVNGSGDVTGSTTLTEGTSLTIRVRKSSSGDTRYIPVETTTTVPAADSTVTVTLFQDPIAS